MPDSIPDIKHSRISAILKRVGYISLSSVLKFGVQIAIIIIFSHKLSLTDYGRYQFVWMYINFFSLLGLFGLTSLILSTPLLEIKELVKKHRLLLSGCFVALNSIAILFLFVYGKNFTWTQKELLLILLIFQNIALVLESIAIKNKQEKKVLLSNWFYLLIYAAAHLYLIYTHYSLTHLLFAVIVATAIKSIVLFYHFSINLQEASAPAAVGKQWFFLGLNDMLGVMVKWVDKWFLLFFLPASQFAIYFNGTYEIPVFMLILSAIGSVSLVEFSNFEDNITGNSKLLFSKMSLLMAAWVFPSFWFFLFYADSFILTIFGEKYLEAIPVFKASILILPVRIVYSTTILQVYHKTNIILRGTVLDLILAIIFMVALYPFWGLPGVAIAFVLSTYLQVGYYLWHTAQFINERIAFLIPFKKLIFIFIISGAVVGASNLLSTSFNDIYRMATGMGTGAVAVACFLYLFYKTSFGKKTSV